jgi:hypothetical protein
MDSYATIPADELSKLEEASKSSRKSVKAAFGCGWFKCAMGKA